MRTQYFVVYWRNTSLLVFLRKLVIQENAGFKNFKAFPGLQPQPHRPGKSGERFKLRSWTFKDLRKLENTNNNKSR